MRCRPAVLLAKPHVEDHQIDRRLVGQPLPRRRERIHGKGVGRSRFLDDPLRINGDKEFVLYNKNR